MSAFTSEIGPDAKCGPALKVSADRDRSHRRTVKSTRLLESDIADLCYSRFFELAPDARDLFPSDMERQRIKLMDMIAALVGSLEQSGKQFTRSELRAHNSQCALLQGTRLLAAVQKDRRERVSEHLTDNLRHLSR